MLRSKTHSSNLTHAFHSLLTCFPHAFQTAWMKWANPFLRSHTAPYPAGLLCRPPIQVVSDPREGYHQHIWEARSVGCDTGHWWAEYGYQTALLDASLMIVSDHCSTGRRLMRNYRRELRCRQPMCMECEDAVKAAASERQVIFKLFFKLANQMFRCLQFFCEYSQMRWSVVCRTSIVMPYLQTLARASHLVLHINLFQLF